MWKGVLEKQIKKIWSEEVGGGEMTKEQIQNNTKKLSLRNALHLAFVAGESRAIASHVDFVQIHEPSWIVCDALAKRVKKTRRIGPNYRNGNKPLDNQTGV